MKQNNQNWYLLAFLVVIFLFVAIRFRPLFYIVIIIGGVAIALGFLYFIFKFLWKLRIKNLREQSLEGSLERQFEQSREQILKNKNEIIEIQKAIDDLEHSLDNKLELLEKNRKKSKKILAGFYKELELRKAKIDFYETCQTKLDTLQYNHNFSKELTSKQKKLNEFQEDHFNDITDMESFKKDLEYNKYFMETIETLSLRMLESNSLDSAQQLQLELKEITKELKRL